MDVGSGMILGTPGSGKSMGAKGEISNVLLRDPNSEVIVLDPEREYAPLADGFDGEVIRIGGGSKSCINPMDINMDYSDDEQPLALKSELVLTLCELLIGGKYGLSGGQRSLIGRACSICYRKYFQHPCPENIPTLRDFYEVLKSSLNRTQPILYWSWRSILRVIYLSLQTIQMLIPISVFWFTTSETWANSSALLGWLW